MDVLLKYLDRFPALVEEAESDYNNMKRLRERYKQELEKTRGSLHSANSRLCESVKNQVEDVNLDVSDQSADKNRPEKLAERFHALYDNEWSDAYEELDRGNDEEVCTRLLKIFLYTMEFCKRRAEMQISGLQHIVTFGHRPGEGHMSKSSTGELKNARKAYAGIAGEHLYEEFFDDLKRSASNVSKDALTVEPYLKESFMVSWLMCVQNPPIVLGPAIQKNESLDSSSMYGCFSKSGVVDFMVWPSVLLYEKGQLLCNGVAQGDGSTAGSPDRVRNRVQRVKPAPRLGRRPLQSASTKKDSTKGKPLTTDMCTTSTKN